MAVSSFAGVRIVRLLGSGAWMRSTSLSTQGSVWLIQRAVAEEMPAVLD
jgi:hypothetical protein